MRAKEFEVRATLLLIILAETAAIAFLLYQPKPAARSEFTADAGSNISLLINGERFPIDARPGQKVTLIVEDTKKSVAPLPPRVVIPYTEDQKKMTRVSEPRFRFVYDDPKTLHWFMLDEKLENLRVADEWGTVVNVLKWGRSQFKPGTPRTYPTQNAGKLLPLLRSGKEEGFCAQYAYIAVQALQALGYKARYVSIINHEVAEVWLPRQRKWVAIDPLNAAYYEDARGRRLSALEVYRGRDSVKIVSDLPNLDAKEMAAAYGALRYWLRNDLFSRSINIYDLPWYRVHLMDPSDLAKAPAGELVTIFPEEIYAAPEEKNRSEAE